MVTPDWYAQTGHQADAEGGQASTRGDAECGRGWYGQEQPGPEQSGYQVVRWYGRIVPTAEPLG